MAAGLVLLGTVRIVSTYWTFSHTFDEPAHIACGMQWIEHHIYTYETQHPPLTRVMVALLPRIFGAHGWGKNSMWDEGLAILAGQGNVGTTLALARAGTLPFFWIACWLVFQCTRWISGSASTAVLAVFLASMTPTVLAHAGLATTDMGLTAMLLLALYTGWRWLEQPAWWRSAAFGASTGLAVLAKFSTLAFLPSIAAVGLLVGLSIERLPWKRLARLVAPRAGQLPLAIVIGAFVIWAGYLFSFGKTASFSFPVPAPELFSGVREVQKHNATGHLTYLLGATSTVGWPYFYIVALGVKAPLPLLALGLPGLVLLFSRKLFGGRGWMMPAAVLGILIFSSFFTQIKIGTRHVLPVFLALAVAGACAAVWWLRRPSRHNLALYTIGFAFVWMAASSLAAHPDYLGYFNRIAGSKPEAFLVDSDLDWGQDVKRLGRRLKELGAQEVYFNQYAPGDLRELYGFPVIHPLELDGPRPGWNAVSLTPMKYGLFGGTRYVYDSSFQFWPERLKPEERIGTGILLFYSPPGR